MKKLPEETNDQDKKQRNIYHNLTLFKTIFNYNIYPRGCTDSNVRIIYQVKRFFKKVNLFKRYFSGPVNLEKKKLSCVEGSPACLSSPGQANFDFHTKLGQKFALRNGKLAWLEERHDSPWRVILF